MSSIFEENSLNTDSNNIKSLVFRLFAFWPYFVISVFVFIIIAFLYLRYADYEYFTYSKLEIIDKAQDSEMALPTAMTIFNRSMINVDNELGVLNSFNLHKRVVSQLKSNVKYYTVGNIVKRQDHYSEWLNEFNIDFKFDTDTITKKQIYDINFTKQGFSILKFDHEENLISSDEFKGKSTKYKKHNLPFDLTYDDDDSNLGSKKIEFLPFTNEVNKMISLIKAEQTSSKSDQLDLSIQYTNSKLSREYLDKLMLEFDLDGITDRQLEYKRTIEFVDNRSEFLSKELEEIELRLQDFKEKNSISDLINDAQINIDQKLNYNKELYNAEAQKDLVNILEETIELDKYDLMPANIGINNPSINDLINDYNRLVQERDGLLLTAGRGNIYVRNVESKLSDYLLNLKSSINIYKESLDLTINSLKSKENEFELAYSNIPKNQKILRSIQRELEVKEALFILLLQKREEAAINYAVVKPSIKVIDYAISSPSPIFPNKQLVYVAAVLIGLFIPFITLYLIFFFDNKIHTKEELKTILKNIPIVAEIPYITNKNDLQSIQNKDSRNILAESIRMIVANLNFILFDKITTKNKKNNKILITSSIKGEGKTLISTNFASSLSAKFGKVLLIGADLRNPQIHKFIGKDKSEKGLSDYIYRNDLDWKNLIFSHAHLDILLSGTIPPNPTQLLASKKFKDFLESVSSIYDYVVIDSAPCLLVSDTFEISKNVDSTLYVVRANFTDKNLMSFVEESYQLNKFPGINIVLNSVGNSAKYGYKYGYQYGYQYGYRYNYGYGYGYSEDK